MFKTFRIIFQDYRRQIFLTEKIFYEKLGIIQRAEMLAIKMGFKEKTNLYLRLRRLLSPKLMGKLFKVILAYKFDNNKYSGF